MSTQRSNQLTGLLLTFATILVLWTIVYWPALYSMVGVWSTSDTFTHCFIIVPVVIYLLYERRFEIQQTNLKPFLPAIIPLIGVQAMFLMSQLLGVNLIGHASAYASLVLIVWLVFGTEFILRFKFPFIFLAFAVPFGEELVPWLQDVTAFLSVELLQMTGIPIYREGLYLYVPNGTFLVAEACAGIRFLIAAIALGTLYAYMNFTTKWKFATFVLVSFVVPILANGFRAYGIVVIGYMSDMEHATGADHLIYGWFFFAFVLVLLFLIGEMFKEKITLVKASEDGVLGNITKPSILSASTMVAAVVAIQIYGALFIFSEYKVDKVASLPSVISQLDKNAKAQAIPWEPQMSAAHERWSGDINGLSAYVAKYHFDNDEAELVSGLNRPFNIEAFSRIAQKTVSFEGQQAMLLEIVDVRSTKVSLIYWYEVDGVRTVSPLKTKLNQVKSKLAGRAGKGYFVAVATSDPELAFNAIQSLP